MKDRNVWQQLEVSGGDGFSFESALVAVIKQCEYELSQAEPVDSSGAIQEYKTALEAARTKYKVAKREFENSLTDEWSAIGGDYATIAKALDSGHYDVLVF